MRACLDASVLVSLFCDDADSARAAGYLETAAPALLVSDFAAAEFAAAVARRARTGDLTRAEAEAIFTGFDAWTLKVTSRVEALPADTALATAWVRRLDLALRAPDAINLAVAHRTGAGLVTFDLRMAAAARSLGVEVAEA